MAATVVVPSIFKNNYFFFIPISKFLKIPSQ